MRKKHIVLLFRCPVLMVTGDKASFNHTVHNLFRSMSQKMDKSKIEILEIEGVANVLEEKVSTKAVIFSLIFRHTQYLLKLS